LEPEAILDLFKERGYTVVGFLFTNFNNTETMDMRFVFQEGFPDSLKEYAMVCWLNRDCETPKPIRTQ
jgi:hypothetical protein